MTTRLKQIVDQCIWEKASILAVAEALPKARKDVEAILEELIEQKDSRRFTFLLYAAFVAGRRVGARLLPRCAWLLTTEHLVGGAICRMQRLEHLPELLIEAARMPMIQESTALCLALAARECVEQKRPAFPPELLVAARLKSRSDGLRQGSIHSLMAVCFLTGDPALRVLLLGPERKDPAAEIALRKATLHLLETQVQMWSGPALDQVPEKLERWGAGPDVKRSVPKLGRNDPCHCGSGNKYKRCCAGKDVERLRLSSYVEGKTVAELGDDPEPHLTAARLKAMQPCDLMRMDPRKIPDEVLSDYLFYLGAFDQVEFLVHAMELRHAHPAVRNIWSIAQLWVTFAWRPDLAARLMALWQPGMAPPRHGMDLMSCDSQPAVFLATVEKFALQALRSGTNDENHDDFAQALLCSPYPALGVLLCRAFIPFLSKTNASALHRELLKARDRLQLSVDDPVSELLDRRYVDEVHAHGEDAEELRLAQQRLDAKNAETRKLQAQIDHLKQELRHQENQQAAEPKPTGPTGPTEASKPTPEPEVLRDLRTKVSSLKGLLTELHHERSGLRQDLQKAYTELKEKRQDQSATLSDPAVPELDEGDLTVEMDFGEKDQPLRVLAFPPKFRETLDRFPATVGRSVLSLLGRLASGESAVFKGVVRLKAAPDHYRIRIGRDHRLIFSLDPECLQVTDLINRRDLDRRIKAL